MFPEIDLNGDFFALVIGHELNTLHGDSCAFLFTRHYIGDRPLSETRLVISSGLTPLLSGAASGKRGTIRTVLRRLRCNALLDPLGVAIRFSTNPATILLLRLSRRAVRL